MARQTRAVLNRNISTRAKTERPSLHVLAAIPAIFACRATNAFAIRRIANPVKSHRAETVSRVSDGTSCRTRLAMIRSLAVKPHATGSHVRSAGIAAALGFSVCCACKGRVAKRSSRALAIVRCAEPAQKSRGAALRREALNNSGSLDVDNSLESLPDWFWRIVILLLCMIWATNFAVIKEITAEPGVTFQLYAISRFTVAAAVLLPDLRTISSPQVMDRSIELGCWVAFGYIGQAIGLMTTTASKSCFICCLNVVFVSLVAGLTKRKLDCQTVLAAVLAVFGVAFLEFNGSQQFVIGDVISLAQPIGFGMGYIRLEELMADSPQDAKAVTSVKLLIVALSAWAFYGLSNGALPDLSPVLASTPAILGILWTGLITTALSLVVEATAFRYVDATSASVIFTTEPLWAALFAVWLISEPFSSADAIGGACVILANVVKAVPTSMLPLQEEDEDA